MVDKELAIKVPENLMVRAPILDDAPAITDLMNACHQKYSGEIGSTVDEVLEDWKLPGFDLARDAWLMLTSDNRIVGYESSWHRENTGRIYLDGYVHPEFNGQGIGTYLLHQAETRAADFTAHYPAEVRICVRASCWSNEAAAVQLFNDEGYHLIRHFWTMAIEMDEPLAPPEWPTGLSVRTFVRGQDEHAVHEAVTEAFRDHWGSVPVPFEEWVATRIETAGFDPSLKFLAVEDTTGEVAGVALCRNRADNLAWVDTLGVRRAWRKHGLGMALLRHAFADFYQRGARKVGLGVDAENPTGATRLYERAGMEVSQRFDSFEKELRPGRNLSPDDPADR